MTARASDGDGHLFALVGRNEETVVVTYEDLCQRKDIEHTAARRQEREREGEGERERERERKGERERGRDEKDEEEKDRV